MVRHGSRQGRHSGCSKSVVIRHWRSGLWRSPNRRDDWRGAVRVFQHRYPRGLYRWRWRRRCDRWQLDCQARISLCRPRQDVRIITDDDPRTWRWCPHQQLQLADYRQRSAGWRELQIRRSGSREVLSFSSLEKLKPGVRRAFLFLPGSGRLLTTSSRSHHLGLPQLRDFIGAEAELGQHLLGLLAEFRRPRGHPAWRARQRHGLADQADMAVVFVRHVLRDAEMPNLRILEHLVDRIDWSAGHAGGVEFP